MAICKNTLLLFPVRNGSRLRSQVLLAFPFFLNPFSFSFFISCSAPETNTHSLPHALRSRPFFLTCQSHKYTHMWYTCTVARRQYHTLSRRVSAMDYSEIEALVIFSADVKQKSLSPFCLLSSILSPPSPSVLYPRVCFQVHSGLCVIVVTKK